MNYEEKIALEFKVKEEVEEEAHKMGLHLQDWRLIDRNEGKRRIEDVDSDSDETLGDEEDVIVFATFAIGELAFADHVLDPERAALAAFEAEFEVEIADTIHDNMSREGGEIDQIIDDLKDIT